ncbi:unnamed protein product, partial [marine sediment metagenome]
MGDDSEVIQTVVGIGIMGAAIATQQYWGIWYYTAAVVAGGAVLQYGLAQALAEDMDMPSFQRAMAGGAGLRANTRSTQEPIKVVYGQLRVGGNDVYMGVSGANNEVL